MRLLSLSTTLAVVSLASCAGTQSEEDDQPLPPPSTVTAEEATASEELPPVEEPTLPEIKATDTSQADPTKVGKWSRSNPFENLPSQRDLTPSLAPLPDPDEASAQAQQSSQPVIIQP